MPSAEAPPATQQAGDPFPGPRTNVRLRQAGILRGDPVAILSLNSPEYVAAIFVCARIGAPLVPINLMLTPDDR